MKLEFNDRHIKTIPYYMYDALGDKIFDYLDDIEKTRLTTTERININKEVLKIRMDKIIRTLREKPKYRDILNGSDPVEIKRIITRHNHYYTLVFSNKIEFRINAEYVRKLPYTTVKRLV